jgi:hypothetical protein
MGFCPTLEKSQASLSNSQSLRTHFVVPQQEMHDALWIRHQKMNCKIVTRCVCVYVCVCVCVCVCVYVFLEALSLHSYIPKTNICIHMVYSACCCDCYQIYHTVENSVQKEDWVYRGKICGWTWKYHRPVFKFLLWLWTVKLTSSASFLSV